MKILNRKMSAKRNVNRKSRKTKNKSKKKMMKIWKYEVDQKIVFGVIFIFGFLIAIYPIISQMYYSVESTQEIEDFETTRKKLDEIEINKKIELAKAYNSSLKPTSFADPYRKKQKEGIAEYARMLEVHEKIGYVHIPKIKQKLPIYAGTNEEVLQKGAGHLEGTSLPVGGASTHTVITAHSGLPTAKLFTDLSKLKIGDKFFIHNLSQVLAYEVDRIKTVEPSNFSDLLINSNRDQATLLTCTPIMINTHRLLVRGHRVPYNPNEFVSMNKNNKLIFWLKVAGFILLIILMALWLYRKTKKKAR